MRTEITSYKSKPSEVLAIMLERHTWAKVKELIGEQMFTDKKIIPCYLKEDGSVEYEDKPTSRIGILLATPAGYLIIPEGLMIIKEGEEIIPMDILTFNKKYEPKEIIIEEVN